MALLSPADEVLHFRYGQGQVLLISDFTAVIRFNHGIEELPVNELKKLVTVMGALRSENWSDSDAALLRAQASAIRSVNEAWGVFSRSRISLLPHQLWVCHKALRKWPIRMLIADDVGMGKTIEAGLILWPLLSKGMVKRLLILTPAKLVEQWQQRLRTMFDIRLAVYRPEVDTIRTDFWATHQQVVASLPTIRLDRNQRHERLLDADQWDLVIVDEAHHLNVEEGSSKTLGYQLLEKLEEFGKIKSCVLFSGTPHRGKDYGFWSLMRLLDRESFGPENSIGTQLEKLPDFLLRNAKQKVVDMSGKRLFQPIQQFPETYRYTDAEDDFYQKMTAFILSGKAYASSLSKAQRGQVMLVLIALQKLASSSIAAVRIALQTRLARLAGVVAKYRDEIEQFDDQDENSDELEKALLKWETENKKGSLQLMENEIEHLRELVDLAERIDSETRIERVVQVIQERFAGEQVLLFTEYKATQALVISALMQAFGQNCVGFINGDDYLAAIPFPDGTVQPVHSKREDVADAFNSGRIRFLVSTEAGGEGIDLQERCHCLIHVDLPWNPMRLHQRVGRLNRYGQVKPVQVVSLRNPDTVESLVWSKLEAKLEAIMLALGNAMDEPEDLLQLVLGMTGSTIFNEIFSEAIDVQKTRLSEWFDEKSKTFGGESAIETIKTLVGHAQSFDLTGLQSVPPLDLPNLQSFFLSSLVYNSRRPEIHGKEISFKTPQLWMNHPSIKSSYSCLYFDRSYRSESGSVCGVGHPIFDQAIDQALSLESPLARIQFLSAPLALFLIFDRVTDTGVLMRETLVGVLLFEEGFKLLKDWEVLLTLAEARGKETKNDQIHNDMDLTVLTNLFVDAKNFLEHHLPSLGLPYKIPSIRDHALLMPF
ncbi:DEAD/DEAH box helicase [Methylosarcina fibrata]|uniref:DEAD/DEAH box helicase n=1 Tax=Methylosarcina fibrata TaxID=105972 RepID=UPI0003A523FB|nr:helicase-related protein [Methylosarcina fibrata]